MLAALKRLRLLVMRYPGGHYVSGYRWRDRVGPKEERAICMELAWHDLEPNTFGTNEFVAFWRKLDSEPYLDTSLVKLRAEHGYEAPHTIKYWSIGNAVDGRWQIGYKTPEENYTEYAKVTNWTDPSMQLLAAGVSLWVAS